MSTYVHSITYNFDVDVEGMEIGLLRISAALYGIIGILRRMGLPEDVDAVVTRLQRVISMLIMLRTSYMLAMAATGPVGWAMAGVGIVGTALTIAEEVEMSRPFY